MKIILKPAIYLMSQLKYLQKFGLISILFAIPIAYFVSAMSIDLQNQVTFAKKENMGLEYNLALRTLLQHSQQHRGLAANYLSGQTALKPNIEKKQVEINNDLIKMSEMEQKYGDVLQTTEQWTPIERDLKDILSQVFTFSKKDSFTRHTELFSKILTLNAHVGDTSNLVIESDITKSYMANAILKTLPNLTEYMGQLRAKGSSALSAATLSDEDKLFILTLLSNIEKGNHDLERDIEVFKHYNPTVYERLRQDFDTSDQKTHEIIDLTNENITLADSLSYDSIAYFDQVTDSIDSIFTLLTDETTILNERIDQKVSSLVTKQILFTSLTALVIIIAIYFFTGFFLSIKETVSHLESVTGKVASGDLTQYVQLNTKDETKKIGTAFNEMIDSFRTMILSNKVLAEELATTSEELSQVADETASATDRITETTQGVAVGSHLQLQSAEEISNALKDVTLGIQRIAETSSYVTESARNTSDEATKGTKSIDQAVKQMESIQKSVFHSSEIVHVLGNRSHEIGKIVQVITDIASQTNLLALNAAIEAARAGEYGKGFSVVADEVRKLAEQSKLSADQITHLIRDIQLDTDQSVVAMQQVTHEVETGAKLVQSAGGAFSQILVAANGVANQIEEVSSVSEEIYASTEEILANVEEMTKVANDAYMSTQNVAASSEEQLASVEEITASISVLTQRAQELHQLIDKFKL